MEDNLFNWLSGVLVAPVSTLKKIAEAKPLGRALLVFVAVSLIGAIVSVHNPQTQELLGQLMADLGVYLSTSFIIISSLVLALLFFLFSAGVMHFVARLFKGAGSFEGLLSAYAFSVFPQVIGAPLNVLATLASPMGLALSGFLSFALSIWVLVLGVIALRESHGLTSGKAVGVYLLHLLIIVVISVAVIIGFVTYFTLN